MEDERPYCMYNPVYIGKIRWNARKQEISTKDGKIILSKVHLQE